MHKEYKARAGFTIVELLIVIVVIAILASISVVAYSGIQARARDSQRKQDISTITKALEMYYVDNNRYPTSSCASNCAVSSGWSSTNDIGWSELATALVPTYISSLPSDPKAASGINPLFAGHGYAYYANNQYNLYCGVGSPGQMYILVYTRESGPQENTLRGDCTTSPLGPYNNRSNYRVANGGS